MDFCINFRIKCEAGRYRNCSFPNLAEIIPYFPTSYFADVTDELLEAVLKGDEELTEVEMMRIAHYNNLPLSFLTCQKLIVLSRANWKHREMIGALQRRLTEMQELKDAGSKYAAAYMDGKYSGMWKLMRLVDDFEAGRIVTYGKYLGVKHVLEDNILFAQGEFRPKPRGLKVRVSDK